MKSLKNILSVILILINATYCQASDNEAGENETMTHFVQSQPLGMSEETEAIHLVGFSSPSESEDDDADRRHHLRESCEDCLRTTRTRVVLGLKVSAFIAVMVAWPVAGGALVWYSLLK